MPPSIHYSFMRNSDSSSNLILNALGTLKVFYPTIFIFIFYFPTMAVVVLLSTLVRWGECQNGK